jgi:hypothetical protein
MMMTMMIMKATDPPSVSPNENIQTWLLATGARRDEAPTIGAKTNPRSPSFSSSSSSVPRLPPTPSAPDDRRSGGNSQLSRRPSRFRFRAFAYDR